MLEDKTVGMTEHSHDDTATPPAFDQDFWNDLYSERSTIWSGNPNPVLVHEVSGLTPGTALDVGCGEGADSYWLADQGWTVTGADISAVALDRARANQGSRSIEWEEVDLLTWAPPIRSFDLISAQFFHLPPQELAETTARFADAIAPGGHLLVVGHSPDDVLAAAHGSPERLFQPSAIVEAAGSEFEVRVAEHRSRMADDQERIDTVVLLQRV